MNLCARAVIMTLFLSVLTVSCGQKNPNSNIQTTEETVKITLSQANRLAQLPLECMQQQFPNKLSQTLGSAADMGVPQELHPAFYGCYDWHSAVHGHWMLISLLKSFPELDNRDRILAQLRKNISSANILAEVAYFQRATEKSYERTYGWAWLLKLAAELHSWDTPIAHELEKNLQPLTDLIVTRYLEFLPKLNYPIRVGEHPNTAFGLTLAWDYAVAVKHSALKTLIEQRALDFYREDIGCPIGWEPGGFDFLSPCLEEADIMRRVLPRDEYKQWLGQFLPQLADPAFTLEPGRVSDRSDGKLVHLDGVNFSRAWCLYGIAGVSAEFSHLRKIADTHIRYSINNITGENYEGSHWLASFAIYALAAAAQ